MKNIKFLEVKFSIYLNRRVFVMQFCLVFYRHFVLTIQSFCTIFGPSCSKLTMSLVNDSLKF